MGVDLSRSAVEVRLRAACDAMAEPVRVPDIDAISASEVAERLREACALWVMCARLGDLGARP